jgi:hypothetical protein
LICPNLVTCRNEFAGISHSVVSEQREGSDGPHPTQPSPI